MNNDEVQKLVCAKSAGLILGVTATTVRRWCRSGELPALNLAAPGKRELWRINPVELQEWLARKRLKPVDKPRSNRRPKSSKPTKQFV